MKRPAFLTAAAAALLAAATASAQTPTVEARIVPDSIGIGDTFTLEIDVERDQVQVTEFPLYENDDKLEVVQSLPVDTLSREGRRLRLRKRYVMQAFSEGRYNLGRPGVLYADKNIVDTLYTSDSLRLDVERSRSTPPSRRSTTSNRSGRCRCAPRRSQDTFSAGCSCC